MDQLQGGFASLTPSKGSAPRPRWGLRPQMLAIGSSSVLAVVRPLENPRSAPDPIY